MILTDTEFLLSMCPEANEQAIEFFTERVGILLDNESMEQQEERVRMFALNLTMKRGLV